MPHLCYDKSEQKDLNLKHHLHVASMLQHSKESAKEVLTLFHGRATSKSISKDFQKEPLKPDLVAFVLR